MIGVDNYSHHPWFLGPKTRNSAINQVDLPVLIHVISQGPEAPDGGHDDDKAPIDLISERCIYNIRLDEAHKATLCENDA